MSNMPDFMNVFNGVVRSAQRKGEINPNRLSKALDVLDRIEPVYYQQEDFTVAVLFQNDAIGSILSVGVSKRNPTDNKLPLRGRALALSRAVRAMLK